MIVFPGQILSEHRHTACNRRLKLNQSLLDNISIERYTIKSRVSKSKQTSPEVEHL
jgi:hypothetical protein